MSFSPIQGFSKWNKTDKIEWLTQNYFKNPKAAKKIILQYLHTDAKLQELHDEFIENTISNYFLPLGVVPNFLINGKLYAVPMAIEESSVVAAASKVAKFWLDRGGFTAEVIDTEKTGQVHFMYRGETRKLQKYFDQIKPKLITQVSTITKNMEQRGGGIKNIVLQDKTDKLANYYLLHCSFDTVDAMGANFINSCLEQFAKTFKAEALYFDGFNTAEKQIEVVMAILSNYVPNCMARASVSCPVEALSIGNNSGEVFANKLVTAVNIAKIEPYRAVTHNKGIMNGIDAVILATGNDFRAVEAGVHAYAAKDGTYRSLTHASIDNGIFNFWIEVPLALGTVGGLTKLHPLVKIALEMLQNPSAKELMQIVAVVGLAQNFAALQSLVTTGIQKGHMKMHLLNILNQLGASTEEKTYFVDYFKDKMVTYSEVVKAFETSRTYR